MEDLLLVVLIVLVVASAKGYQTVRLNPLLPDSLLTGPARWDEFTGSRPVFKCTGKLGLRVSVKQVHFFFFQKLVTEHIIILW